MDLTFSSGPVPRLFAHRGDSARAPENTMEAFRLARDAGIAYFELDVHLSLDHRLVVIHDSSVSRTTGRRGRVENMTLDAIRLLDAGYRFTPDRGRTFPYRDRGVRIPTLEEVLESFPEMRVIVEIKRSRDGIAGAVVEAIHRLGAAERVLVASSEHDIQERVRTLEPRLLTSFSKNEVKEFLARVRSRKWGDYRPPATAFQVPEFFGLRRVVSPATVEAAHRWGLEVHVWTVNEPVHIERLLSWGVDGIVTDDPARALATVGGLRQMARVADSPDRDAPSAG